MRFMRDALALAAKGAGWVAPNPQVGAVLVKGGEVIGSGWHTKCGELHAEREALADCARRGNDPAGATLYVTLEPCCHTGKQPPCTQAVISAGISRVVVGSPDPNPLVAGKGNAALREAGIQVDEGCLTSQCDNLNREWLYFIQTGLPYVTMKYAMTLDGKIATHTGDSKWVTGALARARVHEDRAKTAAVMAGIGTVLADDPLLTARPQGQEHVHQPARVILDAQLKCPLDSQLARSAKDSPVYLACSAEASADKRHKLEDAGCHIIDLDSEDGLIDMRCLLKRLGELGCDSAIAEGGGRLHASLLERGLVNRVQAYIAPKLVGGHDALSPVEGAGIEVMRDALQLEDVSVELLGQDLLVTGYTALDAKGGVPCSRES